MINARLHLEYTACFWMVKSSDNRQMKKANRQMEAETIKQDLADIVCQIPDCLGVIWNSGDSVPRLPRRVIS